MTKDPFIGHSERANELLDLIHTDVCGPLSSDARGGYKYFITFTDDFSKYGYVYLISGSCHSRVIRNQQYLYPKFPPTVVVKLLQYSGSRVKHRDGLS